MKTHCPVIDTPRLSLVRCDLKLLAILLKGNDAISDYLDVTVPAEWTEFGEPAFRWTIAGLEQDNVDDRWFMYLPILKSENTLVGTCGFKGEPKDGMVEIGYEVAKDFRCKGLATEIAGALIHFAFNSEGIIKVQAHTLGNENESGTVLKKNGMQKCAEIIDPEDGAIWQWQIVKP